MEFNVPADESWTKDVVERRNEDWFNVANEVEERAVELDSPGDVADEVEASRWTWLSGWRGGRSRRANWLCLVVVGEESKLNSAHARLCAA